MEKEKKTEKKSMNGKKSGKNYRISRIYRASQMGSAMITEMIIPLTGLRDFAQVSSFWGENGTRGLIRYPSPPGLETYIPVL